MKRYALLTLSIALTSLITACGGGGGGSESPAPQSPAITSASAAPNSSSTTTSNPTTSTPVSSISSAPASASLSLSSAPTSLSSSSSSSISASTSPEVGVPVGALWHDDYALDYRSGIQLSHLDGSLPAQITTRTDIDVNVWPDGEQYVITDWKVYDDYTEITVVDRITNTTVYQQEVDGYLRNAAPSPANKKLIKATHGEDSISPFTEFVLDLSSMQVLYVISDRDWFAWMPDGRFMLINIDTGNMRIASLDSTEETLVGHLDVPADRIMGGFSVSPTGEQFVMVMTRRGSTTSEPDLWIGNIDGSGFEQLTATKLTATAAWSPDGRYIAYTTDTGSSCNSYGCLGSCEQWYTPVNLRKVQGLSNTLGSEVFRVSDRRGNQQQLGCTVWAWTP